MTQIPPDTPSSRTQPLNQYHQPNNNHNNNNNNDYSSSAPPNQSKCQSLLNKLDIFSYVPVPHTYPVSTRKSKIGSLIFILLIVGYLTYDFVKFITQNQPLISSYETTLPFNVQYTMPEIAFGFMYGQSLNSSLNDPSYFTFQFVTINNTLNPATNQSSEQKINVNLISNCNPQWLGQYNNVYRNLTCLSSNLSLMNIPSQNPNFIAQRLVITACQNGSSNVTCQSMTELYKMTSGGRLFVIINLPAGFDYNTGEIDQSDYSVEIYQFFLAPGIYSRINVDFWTFLYRTFPTFLTIWSQRDYFMMQSYEPTTHPSNVTVFNPNLLLGITFSLHETYTIVLVKYQTLIKRLSDWGALASLIMAIFGLCCLTYNRGKFIRMNPGWEKFDKTIDQKKEIQIELGNMEKKKEESIEKRKKNVDEVQVNKQGLNNGQGYSTTSRKQSNQSSQQVQSEQQEQSEDDGGIEAIRKRLAMNGGSK